ncbi:hypothetical protein Tco_1169674 [Tanacetum coccineum]
MIGCKVMRTLASVEFEIILILGLPCCLSSSSVRCLEKVGEIIAASDVDGLMLTVLALEYSEPPEYPVPFPEDPYEAIRQAYLVETETPESPHTISSPTLLLDSTPPTRHAEDSVDSDTSGARSTLLNFTAPLSPDHPLTHASPTLVPILHRDARMVVRVLPSMSPGLSASIA